MSWLETIGIAIGVALDAFAVAIAASVILGGVTARQVFRLSFHFGLFQALMPLIGWLAGLHLQQYIAAYDHWAAFALLAFIGGRALWEYKVNGDTPAEKRGDPTRGGQLIVLAVATSIDALAVGLSFAMLSVSIWYPLLVIGLTTAALTMTGMLLGGRLGLRFGRRAELVGGLVLIGIGVKILLQHLLAG